MIRAVRAAVGNDFIVGIRMSFDEQREVGIGPEEAVRIARRFTDEGIDLISVVRGYVDTDAHLTNFIPPMATPASPHLEFAGWVRKNVDVPVMHAARIADVATARYAIAEGLLDLVGMTRALMADPQLPRKVQAGHADQVRPCVGANMCLDSIYTAGSARAFTIPRRAENSNSLRSFRQHHRANAARSSVPGPRGWRPPGCSPNGGTT